MFNAELPPITASTDTWPIFDGAIADLEASGDPELQRDQIKSSPFRSWVAVYSLVKVVEEVARTQSDAFVTMMAEP